MKAAIYQIHTFQDATNVLHNWIAHRLMKDKMQPGQIEVKLIEQGIDQASATRMVNEVVDELRAKRIRVARLRIISGGIFLIGGIVLSVIFTFVDWWYLVLIGSVLIILGLKKFIH